MKNFHNSIIKSNPILKNGQKTQILFQGRYTNGYYVQKDGHQVNVNEKHLMRYHFTFIRIARIKKSDNNIIEEDVHCWWKYKMLLLLWKTINSSLDDWKHTVFTWLDIYPGEMKTYSHKDSYMNIYSNTIDNSQKVNNSNAHQDR